MNRSGPLIIAFLLVALLGACAFLIPDQQVDDLFGFNNEIVEMTVSPNVPIRSGIAPQAGEIIAAGSLSEEIDVSDLELPFSPSPTSASEGLRAKRIRLFRPTPGADLPATLSLDSGSFEASFTDGVSTFSETVGATFSPALFERDDASCNTNKCDYFPVGDDTLVLDLDSTDIAAILAILASANEPKVATGDASLLFSDDPLLASVTRAQVQVESSGGVISFR